MNNDYLNTIMTLCVSAFTILIGAVGCFIVYFMEDAFISAEFALLLVAVLSLEKIFHQLEMHLLKVVLRKMLIKRITKCTEIGFPQNKDLIKSKEEYEKKIDELRSTVTTQKNELAELRCVLHNTKKTLENQKKRYDLLKSEYTLNIEELIELRESIYKIQNGAELEFEMQKTEPEFPYHSKKKIIIAGGHEQWIHSMKQFIPNAVLIHPSSVNFDSALIKNVDVLWLQTNAMSHSLYYKIIDLARNNGTQIKYFMFASAKKCAIQIFLYESENTSL